MQEFNVRFHSFRDVMDFVSLAASQPYRILVGSGGFQVNATSFMSMVALNCALPKKVTVECTETQLQEVLQVFGRFLVC